MCPVPRDLCRSVLLDLPNRLDSGELPVKEHADCCFRFDVRIVCRYKWVIAQECPPEVRTEDKTHTACKACKQGRPFVDR